MDLSFSSSLETLSFTAVLMLHEESKDQGSKGFPKDLTETCTATRTGSLGEFKRPLPQNPRLPPAGKQPQEFTQSLPEKWRPLELCKAQWHSAFQCQLHFALPWICGQTDIQSGGCWHLSPLEWGGLPPGGQAEWIWFPKPCGRLETRMRSV